jgi:hypothetical protein
MTKGPKETMKTDVTTKPSFANRDGENDRHFTDLPEFVPRKQ